MRFLLDTFHAHSYTRRMKTKTAALILAAGQGKRMHSSIPKVLHSCAGLPLVAHVVKLALATKCDPIVVVVDPQGSRVRETLTALFPKATLLFAIQPVAKGTGDAAHVGLRALGKFDGDVLVLCGDAPLLTPSTLARLRKEKRDALITMLYASVDHPKGYGRVIRQGRNVLSIVEERDATAAQKAVHEINAGVYLCGAGFFAQGRRKVAKPQCTKRILSYRCGNAGSPIPRCCGCLR